MHNVHLIQACISCTRAPDGQDARHTVNEGLTRILWAVGITMPSGSSLEAPSQLPRQSCYSHSFLVE